MINDAALTTCAAEGVATEASAATKAEPRVLEVGGFRGERRAINLRDLGFVGMVSDAARAEIRAAERRSMLVLSTAHLYWFGAR